MIHRLPVLGAIFAGLVVLAMSLAALFTRLPPPVEAGGFLDLTVRTASGARTELIDPGLATVLIVITALAGLTVLFAVEVLQPRAGRKTASARRVRAVEEMMDQLERDTGGR